MKKLTAAETLQYMIEVLMQTLEELDGNLNEQTDFVYGEKTAYIECLEWIQHWRKANRHGLGYHIEERFPL